MPLGSPGRQHPRVLRWGLVRGVTAAFHKTENLCTAWQSVEALSVHLQGDAHGHGMVSTAVSGNMMASVFTAGGLFGLAANLALGQIPAVSAVYSVHYTVTPRNNQQHLLHGSGSDALDHFTWRPTIGFWLAPKGRLQRPLEATLSLADWHARLATRCLFLMLMWQPACIRNHQSRCKQQQQHTVSHNNRSRTHTHTHTAHTPFSRSICTWMDIHLSNTENLGGTGGRCRTLPVTCYILTPPNALPIFQLGAFEAALRNLPSAALLFAGRGHTNCGGHAWYKCMDRTETITVCCIWIGHDLGSWTAPCNTWKLFSTLTWQCINSTMWQVRRASTAQGNRCCSPDYTSWGPTQWKEHSHILTYEERHRSLSPAVPMTNLSVVTIICTRDQTVQLSSLAKLEIRWKETLKQGTTLIPVGIQLATL